MKTGVTRRLSRSKELVAAASYWNGTEAWLARNLLEEEGISAVLSDEQTVAMDWGLINAIGGVKVLVAARDLERARAVLTQHAEREKTMPKAATEPDEEEAADEVAPVLTEQEKNVDRAWLAAALGIAFWPLELYAFYLLLLVYLSDEALRPAKRLQAIVTAVVNIPVLLLGGYLLLRWLLFR